VSSSPVSLARAAALLLTMALMGCGGQSGAPAQHGGAARPSAVPAPPAKPRAAAVSIPGGSGYLAAMASRKGFTLRDRPGGRVVAHLEPRTAWGSPTVVWSVARRGRWLGVIAAALGNDHVGWLDARRDRPRMWRSRLSLHASLSQRVLELWRGRRVIRRMPVAIGAPSTPTPTGRFAITDKLLPDRRVSYYGCCLLALSGHQPHLRPGWAGGNRIAIHGGGSLGGAASAGCLHASDRDLEFLMRVIPLGTPVLISA
jgi:hypothetical protein